MTTVLEHRYQPIGSAREVFTCREPEVLLSGAAGTGKSRACLEKLHAMALANPGMRGLIVRKTATSLGSTALVTFREIVAKEAIESGEMRFYGGSTQEAAAYKYRNGSTIVVGGMDKATRIMSSEYDACYAQEATELTEDDWEMITTRLRNGKVSYQQLMADCNPGAPQHWLNQRCIRGGCTMILCQHEDNPRLYRDGEWTTEGMSYIDRLEALTGVRYQRLRKGLWAAAEGLVYDTFDPAIHLHKPIRECPADWEVYLSVDFGYRNPFTCQWWARDRDDRLYLYRELYMTGRLVEDHAKQIAKYCGHTTDGHREPEPVAVICDHDAEDRATLERHLGRSTVGALKTVSEGIQAVAERLRVRGDGKPGLYICRDALLERDVTLADAHRPLCAQDEVLEYIWDPAQFQSHSSVRAGTTQRESPLKQNDHGMDAMRYAVANIDLQKRPSMRFL